MTAFVYIDMVAAAAADTEVEVDMEVAVVVAAGGKRRYFEFVTR